MSVPGETVADMTETVLNYPEPFIVFCGRETHEDAIAVMGLLSGVSGIRYNDELRTLSLVAAEPLVEIRYDAVSGFYSTLSGVDQIALDQSRHQSPASYMKHFGQPLTDDIHRIMVGREAIERFLFSSNPNRPSLLLKVMGARIKCTGFDVKFTDDHAVGFMTTMYGVLSCYP